MMDFYSVFPYNILYKENAHELIGVKYNDSQSRYNVRTS